jgi:hypothetical protein
MRHSADPYKLPNKPGNAINICAMNGYLDLLKIMITPQGRERLKGLKPSPLYVASARGQVHIIRYLISFDMELLKERDSKIDDPMRIAYGNRQEGSIDALLEGGYRFDKDSWGRAYVDYPDSQLLAKLFRAGLTINGDPRNILDQYMSSVNVRLEDARAFIRVLMTNGISLKRDDKYWGSSVSLAINDDADHLVEILLDYEIEESLQKRTSYASVFYEIFSSANDYLIDIAMNKIAGLAKDEREDLGIEIDGILKALTRNKPHRYVKKFIDALGIIPEDLDKVFIEAVNHQEHKLIEALLEVGMDPSEIITISNVPVIHMVFDLQRTVIMRMFIDYGLDPNVTYTINGRERTVFEDAYHTDIGAMRYIYDNSNAIVTDHLLYELLTTSSRHQFLLWLLDHPKKPLDRNITITRNGRAFSLLDMALFTASHSLIPALERRGFQYKFYLPQEVSQIKESLSIHFAYLTI